MASCQPFKDDKPFDEKVKDMGDDDLLEIWATTQQLDGLISSHFDTGLALAIDYEKTIVKELSLRSCKKLTATPQQDRIKR